MDFRNDRPPYSSLPTPVRGAFEAWLGASVVHEQRQPGGFSPGVASRLTGSNGRTAFLKAVPPGPNTVAASLHRREGTIVAAIPPSAPVPRLLWSHEHDGWVALAFECIEGTQPGQPWSDTDVARVMAALGELHEALTPSPIPVSSAGSASDARAIASGWWQRLADDPPPGLDGWSRTHAARLAAIERAAPGAASGDTLLHLDLRADNMLLTPDRVWFVDWPHAVAGAAWVDVVCLAPSVHMEGGPPPESLVALHPPARSADPADVTAVVAAIAGFFVHEALQPRVPGLPTLRAFQDAQGIVARQWLSDRLGLGPAR